MIYPETTPSHVIIAKINSIINSNKKMIELIEYNKPRISGLRLQLKERGHEDTTIKKEKMYE